MAYAEIPDLQARAGRLSAAWTDSSSPALGDLDRFLDDAAALIDGALASYVAVTPVTGNAAAALRGLNAKLATLDALRATFPSNTGPQEATALIDSLEQQLYGKDGKGGEWAALVGGTHSAVIILKQTGAQPSATSFWTDEPNYGQVAEPVDLLSVNPQMLPTFSRLSKL